MKNNIKNNKISLVILAVSILLVTIGTVSSIAAAQQAIAPSTATPTRYLVSQIIGETHANSGCNWSTGLRTGGVACYDDAVALNTALALSTASSPIDLVFDVSVGLSAPLYIPTSPSVTIEGLSDNTTGIFMLSGSNSTAICSHYPGVISGCQEGTLTGIPPSAAGSVVIKNLAINGNRGTYPSGNSNATDARCTHWCFGISVANLKYFSLENVYLYDIPTFASLSANVDRQEYHNIRVNSPTLALNADGIHMDGPHGQYVIDGVYCHTGDDCIADNTPEGYGGNSVGGTISNITVDNVLAVFRAYTYAGGPGSYTVGPTAITNVSGTIAANNGIPPAFARIGFTQGNGVTDAIQSVTIENANIQNLYTTGQWWDVGSNAGNLICTNCTMTSPTAGTGNQFFNFNEGAVVSNMVFNNSYIYRTAAGNGAAYLGQVSNSSTIKRLELNGVGVVNANGQSTSGIAYLLDVPNGGAITNLILDAVDPKLNPTLLNGNEWARIGSFYGPGVSQYYRNTTYANLPPATYPGLEASISDSSTQTWGATAAGSSTSYAMLNSNGTNWTVIGK